MNKFQASDVQHGDCSYVVMLQIRGLFLHLLDIVRAQDITVEINWN